VSSAISPNERLQHRLHPLTSPVRAAVRARQRGHAHLDGELAVVVSHVGFAVSTPAGGALMTRLDRAPGDDLVDARLQSARPVPPAAGAQEDGRAACLRRQHVANRTDPGLRRADAPAGGLTLTDVMARPTSRGIASRSRSTARVAASASRIGVADWCEDGGVSELVDGRPVDVAHVA
jgi:hypothetical protein